MPNSGAKRLNDGKETPKQQTATAKRSITDQYRKRDISFPCGMLVLVAVA
jgi:hypothetical protein